MPIKNAYDFKSFIRFKKFLSGSSQDFKIQYMPYMVEGSNAHAL